MGINVKSTNNKKISLWIISVVIIIVILIIIVIMRMGNRAAVSGNSISADTGAVISDSNDGKVSFDLNSPCEPIPSSNYIDNKYMAYMSLAEDELDYYWDNDYEVDEYTNTILVCDSKSYRDVFDFDRPTLEDLKTVIKANSNIPENYKKFFIGIVSDYLDLYPNTDFSVLYYNLKTLRINECTPDVIKRQTGSSTTSACYTVSENQIYINKNINISSRSNDDYVVLCHEFLHAAKSTSLYNYKNKYTVNFLFFENEAYGFFAEEALDMCFAYEIQGYNNGSIHYTVACNYYRVVLDCLDGAYDGSDFINHSVNYLPYLMDNYMGEKQGAYKCVAMIEAISSKYYSWNSNNDYASYDYLNEYVTKMYMKKYLQPGMNKSEAEAVFDKLMEELTFNFENMTRPYDGIKEDNFRPTFEKCCDELGINL